MLREILVVGTLEVSDWVGDWRNFKVTNIQMEQAYGLSDLIGKKVRITIEEFPDAQ